MMDAQTEAIILRIYSVVGAGTCIALFLCCVVWLILSFYVFQNRRKSADEEARVRAIIGGQARWFAEDEATMDAIESIAKGEDPEVVRERWRRKRKEQKDGSS